MTHNWNYTQEKTSNNWLIYSITVEKVERTQFYLHFEFRDPLQWTIITLDLYSHQCEKLNINIKKNKISNCRKLTFCLCYPKHKITLTCLSIDPFCFKSFLGILLVSVLSWNLCYDIGEIIMINKNFTQKLRLVLFKAFLLFYYVKKYTETIQEIQCLFIIWDG